MRRPGVSMSDSATRTFSDNEAAKITAYIQGDKEASLYLSGYLLPGGLIRKLPQPPCLYYKPTLTSLTLPKSNLNIGQRLPPILRCNSAAQHYYSLDRCITRMYFLCYSPVQR